MAQLATKLSLCLDYIAHEKDRRKVNTKITVKLGDMIVASRTLGGKYDQDQARKEFRRNHKMFDKGPAFDAHVLPFESK